MNINKLINWYLHKHPSFTGDNSPANTQSTDQLNNLILQLLSPLEDQFGTLTITYGFTSFDLLKYIKKNSPGDMSPEIDQHAAFELNSRKSRICKRDGAACDIYVAGYENQMHIIAEYVINELPFDRLYFYGSDRPIHISFGPDHSRYVHIKHRDEHEKSHVGKGETGNKALILLQNSI